MTNKKQKLELARIGKDEELPFEAEDFNWRPGQIIHQFDFDRGLKNF